MLVDILVFAPSLGILCDIDFHAGTDERVLQFAVVDKHFVFERAHENGFDAFVLDDFHDVFLRGIDALAHEALVIVWLGVSDVAFDGELHRFDVACLVGHGDGASVRAVDEGALRIAAHSQTFKNRLDHHARDTHEECRAQIDDDNHAAREDEEIIVPSDVVDEEVEHLCQHERKGTGVEHLQQVDKLRIAQDARISVKQPKADEVDGGKGTEGAKQRQMFLRLDVVAPEPKDQESAEEAENDVEDDDAPVGQFFLTKIPVKETCQKFHIVLNFGRMAYGRPPELWISLGEK